MLSGSASIEINKNLCVVKYVQKTEPNLLANAVTFTHRNFAIDHNMNIHENQITHAPCAQVLMGEDALYRVNRVSQLGNLLTVEAGIDQLLQRIPDEPTTHRAHHHRYNNPSRSEEHTSELQSRGHL